MNLKTSRIQSPSKSPNDAALPGSVPTFEHDNCPLSRPQVGLLDCLKRRLHRTELAFVVCKINFLMLCNGSKPRAPRHDEIFAFHARSLLHDVYAFALSECSRGTSTKLCRDLIFSGLSRKALPAAALSSGETIMGAVWEA
jgi:hypothetical protein